MDLLQHGVDRTVIALWLGHESTETIDVYLHANLDMKEKALAKTSPTYMKQGRYKPDDEVLKFLRSL
jgi:integrase